MSSGWNDWGFVLQSPLPAWVLALFTAGVIIALALASRAYFRAGRRYWPLIALQSLSALLVIILLLQPALDLRLVEHVPGRIAVVIDDSASMAQKDEGEETRFARVEKFLGAQKSALEAWRERQVVEYYTLSGAGVASAPKGASSPLLEALSRPLETSSRARPLAGVVLLSDGADTDALGAATTTAAMERLIAPLKERGVPVSTIAVGGGKTLDLFVAQVAEDSIAFVRNTAKVEVTLGLHSSEPQTLQVPVTLLQNGQLAQQQVVSVKSGQPTKLTFEFVPDQVGEFVYSVAVPPQPGESVLDNNHQEFIVKVVRDKIRALLVAGRPSWDERFLRHALKSSPNVDLISFFILRTPQDLYPVPTEELSLIPFPTNELFGSELHTFDVVILQNFGYRPYNMGYLLQNLREHVMSGGALVMLGGENSFGGGAYGQTPLADVLPVIMSDDALDDREFTPLLTPAGEKHPVLKLAAGLVSRSKVLERLPKLAGTNKVDGLVPGATALLVHPDLKGKDGKPLPIVAVREVGKGRTMAVMTDSVWRWSFTDKMHGEPGGAYDRFIMQTLRWLMRDPEVSRLRLVASKERVKIGEDVDFTVRALGSDYQPLAGAQVGLQIAEGNSAERDNGPDAEISGESGADGTFTFPYTVKHGGVIRVTARAELDGEALEASLLVFGDDAAAERAALAPRPDLLSAIAKSTGGSAQALETAHLEKVELGGAETVSVDRHKEVPLWQSWPALLLLATTLSLEWILRRRWGFV